MNPEVLLDQSPMPLHSQKAQYWVTPNRKTLEIEPEFIHSVLMNGTIQIFDQQGNRLYLDGEEHERLLLAVSCY